MLEPTTPLIREVSMEEADLLKERLLAITDKRRVQEDIAKKRRQIEEEKLKLQYIKKKALREKWLMEGLSQQTEEEQEAMKLQALDEEQQSSQLQANIDRMEKEIEALEAQELNISTNEEVILKRLKEVERTAEDIIKELSAESQADVNRHGRSPLPDIALNVLPTPQKAPPTQEPGGGEHKKATFAMEISVERDIRTGESQVLSTATVTPDMARERGVKVYDDGRKSIFALQSDGGKLASREVREMTPLEVEELLRQATDKKVPSEVQYHQPVYSVAYPESSRPSTPRAASRSPRQAHTPSPRTIQTETSARNRAQNSEEQSQLSQKLEQPKSLGKMLSFCSTQQDTVPRDGAQRQGDETQQSLSHIPSQARPPQSLTNRHTDTSIPGSAALVSVTARSEGMPIPVQPVYKRLNCSSPSPADLEPGAGLLIDKTSDCSRQSPFYPESEASLNLGHSPPEDLESDPITMIFMGYQNAEDDDDEEEEDIHAELVIISTSDDDDGEDQNENGSDDFLSYHPEGYRSKVFQPKVGVAKIVGCRDIVEEASTCCDDVLPHKPTFIHQPAKHSACPDRQGTQQPASPASITLENTKHSSTGRAQ
ncbi:palmdelphin isoform X5 [Lampris incognitus]|uniref:palmdelphin isoform X5 n=1 Tax=Lampris incognitus TaxID=2546036 RepID=UPI0024B5F899|nr:palmdelphin isoform X5 [Lampris incognitus]